MVGEHLMPELYVAIEEAKKKNSLVKKNNILFKHSDAVYTINISVVPIHDNARKEQCYLIVFEKTVNSNFTVIDSIGNDTYNEELQKLRDELRSTKEHLQSIIEEKDEVNQELWASNEEVQSTNEELQSVNEEMEAAKEELESSNEELLALNEELRSKNSELNAAKYFSDNIVETARAIFITTDVNLKISSVNSFAEQLTGYSRNEIIGKNCMTVFFSQSTSDPSINFFNELLTDKIDSCQFDNRLVISDGSDRLISWRCSILKDANSFRYRILMIGFDITRQRIAEISLAESENNYRELVETSQDLIWQSDSEGRYTYLNPACEEIFEYEINEMLGKFIFDFESPETTAPLKKMLQHLHSGEVIKGYETIQLNKSGKNIHLNMYAVPEYADNETLKKIRGTAHNVTNWKRSESQYQRLFSEMLDGFALHEIICDTSGKPVDYKFLSINPAFEHQTGLKAEIIIGKTVREILPKVEESWINTYGEVALTGKPALFENYSSDLHKYFTVRAYRPAHHQFACIISDVTEQKCAEITLKNLLERFDQLSLQTKTFLWETDTVGLLTFVSPSIKNILGYTPEEIIGNLHFYDLHPDEGRDSFRESVLKMMKEHKNFIDYQNIIVTKDNQQVWVSVYATPHFNSDGELVGYRGGNTDISERKNSETIRQKLEQQHQQTQRLESLGVLAGGIAHDFNNLLGGIFGFIDLAIDECKQTKGVQYLTTALSTIERARSLTQQLLTFAKGGSPVKSVGNLFPFLQDTVKFVLSGSNVSCRFEIDPNLKPCDFDKNQIGQVFDNIIINAMQAMPMGGMIHLAAKNVCIPANFHSSLKEGEHVKISVSDSGIGIPPDLISRIFDPFFTTKTKGHGLGLATCYSIVTRHGGYIEAESVLGKGSTFHVYLPVSQETTSPIITEKPIRHSGKGIFLVMDDEEVIRMTMETMLSLFGYNVVCKESGQDTLNFFFESLNSDSVISGIILDLTIPGGMGGKEVIEEIRKLDKNIPVFVSSGYADDPVMSDPEKYGFTGSICKPFRIMDLTKLLSVHIDTNHKITDENGIN
jgi:PAS domain S-box-containing protein